MTVPIRDHAVSTHFFALPRALDLDRFVDWLVGARHALDEAESVERSRHPERSYGARREILCTEDGQTWLRRFITYTTPSGPTAGGERGGSVVVGVATSAHPQRRDGTAGAICRTAWPDVNGNPVFVDGRIV